MRRRAAIAAGAASPWVWAAARATPLGEVRTLKAPAALAQIAQGGDTGLLGVSVDGDLFALSPNGQAARLLAEGISAEAPLAVGHQRLAARRRDGSLWVQEAGRVGVSSGVALAPAAGLLILPLAIIGIEQIGTHHHVVRLEPDGAGHWRRVARSSAEVLPDARPVQADLDGAGDGGHVVVLAGPDSQRYPHGVLGDTVEATRLALLERHSLALMRELVMAAPLVLEDIAPRRVAHPSRDGSPRDGLLSVQAGPQGGQLVFIDADPASRSGLRIAARGPAIGLANRWMSPTTSGAFWLSVHTPHIGGVLHAYRHDGERLQSTRIRGGVSNHVIGSRQLDLCAWQGSRLLIPDQSRRRLSMLEGRADWQALREWRLPSGVAATLSLPGEGRWAALLESGSVAVL